MLPCLRVSPVVRPVSLCPVSAGPINSLSTRLKSIPFLIPNGRMMKAEGILHLTFRRKIQSALARLPRLLFAGCDGGCLCDQLSRACLPGRGRCLLDPSRRATDCSSPRCNAYTRTTCQGPAIAEYHPHFRRVGSDLQA